MASASDHDGAYYEKARKCWSTKWDLPRDPVTGARRTKRKSGFKTLAEALAYRRKMLGALDAGFIEPSKLTLAEFATETFLPSLDADLELTTAASYRSIVETRILPELGHVLLQDLKPLHAHGLMTKLASDTGRSNGKGKLSVRSQRLTLVTLNKLVNLAVELGLLADNPVKKIKPPRAATAKADAAKARGVWTGQELRKFLVYAKDDRDYAAYVLMSHSGIRRGEAGGLRWTDCDLEAGRLTVAQALVRVGDVSRLKPPKTPESRRTIPLQAAVVEALKAHRKRQAEEQMAFGPGYQDSGLVFRQIGGEPMHPNAFSQRFGHVVANAGVPRIRLHDLRHTFATLALRAGEPVKKVAAILGHSSTQITMDIYQHCLTEDLTATTDSVADLIAL